MFGRVQEAGGKGVPAGIYKAEFLGAEFVPENPALGYGAGWKFRFRVLDEGLHRDGIASRICGGTVPKVGTVLGKFLSEITGIPLVAGASFDEVFPACIGKPFTIVVKQGERGGTKVDTAMRNV